MYISFTLTKEENNELISEVYYIDLQTEEVKKIVEVPYTSQYPLTAYSKRENVVYYTAKDETGNADQVYKYDLEKQEITQLTDSFFAINYIIPTDTKIFIGGIPLNANHFSVRPFVYDIDTKRLKDLTWDEDLNFSFINYDPVNNDYIASAYSSTDEKLRISNQDIKPYEPGTNYLYRFNESNHKQLLKSDGIEIDAVAINGDNNYFSNQRTFLHRIKSSKSEKDYENLDWDNWSYEALIYVDDKYAYFINDRTIFKYDIDSKENKVIFEDNKDERKINNAIILSE
ncbi:MULTISPECIES: DPP IV N-terminal domain-containing protein [unclassified Breznakia]|uniref:DPP IV N-terminal domain-containing protein n=1 Tax=unclassified Breznakia TaxID=2623764 RepID=UPI00240669BA|nr:MULTISPECIES: DPP IV N-terminal domain-containing protein [unclassified Breznakia]